MNLSFFRLPGYRRATGVGSPNLSRPSQPDFSPRSNNSTRASARVFLVRLKDFSCRILPSIAALTGMLGDAVKAQTPEFQTYWTESFTVPNGQIVVTQRPDEIVVPPTPEVFSANGPSQLIQGAILGNPWYNIEREVVSGLLDLHALPADQRSRLLRWERNAVRAGLWTRVELILGKTHAQRTEDERGIVASLNQMFKQMRIDCAQKSIEEYIRWLQNPNQFYPPEPFTYNRPPPGNQNLYYLYGGPKPPAFQEFQAYGPLVYYRSYVDEAVFARIASETAERNKTLVNVLRAETSAIAGGAIAGTIVTAVAAANLGAALAGTIAGEAIIAGIAPFAVQIGAQSLATLGASMGGTIIGVVVLAVVTSVFEGMAVTDAAALPGKLNEALQRAKDAVIDLPTMTGAGLPTSPP